MIIHNVPAYVEMSRSDLMPSMMRHTAERGAGAYPSPKSPNMQLTRDRLAGKETVGRGRKHRKYDEDYRQQNKRVNPSDFHGNDRLKQHFYEQDEQQAVARQQKNRGKRRNRKVEPKPDYEQTRYNLRPRMEQMNYAQVAQQAHAKTKVTRKPKPAPKAPDFMPMNHLRIDVSYIPDNHPDNKTFNERFEILGQLGKGNNVVYQIRDRDFNRIYAAKFVNHNGDETYRKYIRREFQIGQEAYSPYSVQYLYFYAGDTDDILVMEFCEFGDLLEYIKKMADANQIIPEPLIWKVIYQMSFGLTLAHDKGLVHADIKPQNIFLTADGIKLGDYGLGNRMRSPGELLYDPAGTEDYEAPVY